MIDIIALTRELIMTPSESSDPLETSAGVERKVAARLEKLCRDHHVSCETPTVKEGRDNLIVRLPAPGKPRLVFMAHMDTVSGRAMDDPFGAKIDGSGRIHGRGACDDKGPLACLFATVINLKTTGKPLAFDLTLAATVDEEVSMAGAGALAATGETWDLAIALEPTSLKVITAHKGAWRCRVITRGRAAHSSVPEHGYNAIYKMLPIITDLREYGQALAMEQNPQLGRATLAITRISGGTSLNIIPDRCEIGVDIRLLPAMVPEKIAADINRIIKGRGEVEEIYQGRGIKTDNDLPLVKSFLKAIETAGVRAETITAPFATDCSRLAHICPCIVWGPGDIALAHRAEERIEIKELETASRVLENFLVKK